MATVPYVTGSPWWSAANLNGLLTEFDRRLTKALTKKTPYLLGNYGVGSASTAAVERKWFLPISLSTSSAVVDGVLAPTGVMGAVFVMAGGSNVYFERTTPFDQDDVDTDADTATEVSRNTGTKVMVVDDTSLSRSLDWSLKALQRTDGPDTFWLAPESTGGRRAMRRHRYAVAEIIIYALESFTVPREWDRFGCFRIHNMSGFLIPVTVETTNADGSPGTDQTFEIDNFECQAFRREPGYYDASLRYFWKARAGIDKRFWEAKGASIPEKSAWANPIAHPNIIKEWLDTLGAQRDPYVLPPDESARYTGLFGDKTDPTTPVHDLVAHAGACKTIQWDDDDLPIEKSGTVGLSSSLATDLAAVDITVTSDGDTYTFTRASTAEGVEATGLDLFCMGSNVLWLPSGTVTVPGFTPFSQPERQRQYHTLPVTLVEDVPIGPLQRLSYTGYDSAGVSTGTISRTLYGSTATYGTGPKYGGTRHGGSTYNVKRLSEIGDALDTITAFHATAGDWRLTPLGWARLWTYSFTFTSGISAGGQFEPLNGGVWQRWDETTVERKAWLHIKSPGWEFYSLKPTRNRVYGLHVHDSSGPDFWATEDWSGILSKPDGSEPTATGKVLIEYPTLRYLSSGTTAQAGDVFDRDGLSNPVDLPETRYRVMVESDEARSAVDEISLARREQYNKGIPTVAAGENPDVYYHRRPMQVEDWNLLAWSVNAWTRQAPLITIRNLWLKRTNDPAYPGIYVPPFVWDCPGGIDGTLYDIPKNAAWGCAPGTPSSTWTKTLLATVFTLQDREDLPSWITAKENVNKVNGISYSFDRVYEDLYTSVDPFDPDTTYVIGTGHRYFTSSSVASSSQDITDSAWDYPNVDPDFYWVTTETIQAIANSYDLPFVHILVGEATQMYVRAPDTSIPTTETVDDSVTTLQTITTGDPVDLSDRFDGTYSGTVSTPAAIADRYPAATSGTWQTINGNVYSVDANGVPTRTAIAYHRGSPTSVGNNVPGGEGLLPYYSASEAQILSKAVQPIGVTLIMDGFTDGRVNSRLLLGTEYTRAVSVYNGVTGGITGGSWSYNGTMEALDLTAGFNFYLPTAVKEQPTWFVCDPYIDLEA